jgi:hypothetical protein
MQATDSDAVRAHLAKILESGGFVKADRLCRFLRFTVEAKLSGEEGQIKEYVLGREVFDRNGSYDPRLDPIVRVEARRLRTKLEEYYSAAGRADTLRIEFPKGSYVPVIHTVEGSASAGEIVEPSVLPGGRIAVGILALVLLLAALLAGYRWLRPAATSEMVAVAPTGWLWGEPEDAMALEENLAERISIELTNQHVARVIGWPLMLRYRTGRQEFRQMAAGVGAAKMLLIQEKPSGVAVFLLEGASGAKLWVGEYAPADNQTELARAIVRDYVAKEKDLADTRSKIERSKINP